MYSTTNRNNGRKRRKRTNEENERTNGRMDERTNQEKVFFFSIFISALCFFQFFSFSLLTRAGCNLCSTSRTPSTASTTLRWTGCSRMPSVALLSRYSDMDEHTRGRAAVALNTAACTVSCVCVCVKLV